LKNQREIQESIVPEAEKLFERNQKAKLDVRTLTLKIKFHDFVQITRSNPITLVENDDGQLVIEFNQNFF